MYFFSQYKTCTCMHIRRYQNWGRNDLWGNDLGGNGIGGETTRVWGRNTKGENRGETT